MSRRQRNDARRRRRMRAEMEALLTVKRYELWRSVVVSRLQESVEKTLKELLDNYLRYPTSPRKQVVPYLNTAEFVIPQIDTVIFGSNLDITGVIEDNSLKDTSEIEYLNDTKE